MMKRLRDYSWDVAYSHEDGNLVDLFFIPALERAKLYRRATGYFSGSALAMAARGMDALIDCGGRMELLVGCTLDETEVEKIERGYNIRRLAEEEWGRKLTLPDNNPWARRNVGYLAWMIAHGHLDVKLAIPLDEQGRMRGGLGIYHAKMGIVLDESGDQLVFRGSINETEHGWRNNCESFDVNCSWVDGNDAQRVRMAGEEFGKLWSGQARSARVIDFPDALKEKLLEFLPKDDTFVRPPKRAGSTPDADEEAETGEAAPDESLPAPADVGPSLDERRRQVWSYIAHAPKRPDGAMVAVVTSAVKPWPHQLRAYKRMLDNWPLRLLIADEVGLGKTIEAGLIIRHAHIAELAKRILIMAPKAVLRQWQTELYEKFNLLVPIYTGKSLAWPKHHAANGALEVEVGRTAWTEQPIVLVGSELVRRRERATDMVSADPWDLIILDEAHHARRKAPGSPRQGGPNKLLALMHQLKDRAKSLLLLTATPMQVHPVEIWDLLSLLGMPLSWNDKVFVEYFEALATNPDAGRMHELARLFQATEAMFEATPAEEIRRLAEKSGVTGRIAQEKVLKALRDHQTDVPLRRLENDQRRMALALLRSITPIHFRMSRHTRGLLRQYYKAGKLSEPIPDREPVDVAVQLSPAERLLYEAVEQYISETYEKAAKEKKTAVGFVMTIYRRRLASSFFALQRTLNARLADLGGVSGTASGDDFEAEEDLSDDETGEDVMASDDAEGLKRDALLVEEKDAIVELLGRIAKLPTDTKARVLVENLESAFAAGYTSAIVFTQYTATMDFLKEYLAHRLNRRTGCYSGRGGEARDASGRWSSCSKETIKQRLRSGEVEVLLCTDAAGVGLNLQTCGVLVNYDLPWNPMKVEQRIGRIDRIGQKYPSIRIINLAYAGTVEADVYFALSDRIQLFQGVVGKLQPILALLPKEFERATLASRGDRDRACAEARQHVEKFIKEGQAAAFDIDEVSEADLTPPDFPPTPLSPEDMTAVLRRQDLIPAGAEVAELEPRTFKLLLPGQAQPARVTAQPDIFDEHVESLQLIAHDGPLFRRLIDAGAPGCEQEDVIGIEEFRRMLRRMP
jgi:SNF2 family DNA or RNA helicase